ncbi:Uncharacterized protein OBRU01_24295, partial [Operophtera brumata]
VCPCHLYLHYLMKNQGTVEMILRKIGHLFEPTTRRSKAFDARTQILIALRFYATGCFQKVMGDLSTCHKIVADCKLKIRKIIARWPGSVHDSTILNNSPLCAELENGRYKNFYLLGDSGYFCKHFLQTPILNPQSIAEENYNKSHITTRNTVERCIGVRKRRFPCIHSDITLRKMDTILKVIVATAVLHNIVIEIEEEPIPEDLNIGFDIPEVAGHGEHDFSVRTSLVNTVF